MTQQTTTDAATLSAAYSSAIATIGTLKADVAAAMAVPPTAANRPIFLELKSILAGIDLDMMPGGQAVRRVCDLAQQLT